MVKMGQNQTGFLCPAFNLNKLSPIRLRLAVISQCHWLKDFYLSSPPL